MTASTTTGTRVAEGDPGGRHLQHRAPWPSSLGWSMSSGRGRLPVAWLRTAAAEVPIESPPISPLSRVRHSPAASAPNRIEGDGRLGPYLRHRWYLHLVGTRAATVPPPIPRKCLLDNSRLFGLDGSTAGRLVGWTAVRLVGCPPPGAGWSRQPAGILGRRSTTRPGRVDGPARTVR